MDGVDTYVNDEQVSRGREIHRRTGNTFYYATRLLPARVRDDVYVLYGFFRVADEVVDGEGFETAAAQRQRLESMREAALGRTPADDPVVAAFAELRRERNFATSEVDAFVDAMLADVDTDRYETYDDLATYVRGSAAAVGHMLSVVFGTADREAARPHAAALGEALQLTNFLRDVREDYHGLGRIYLPQSTLEEYGVCEADFQKSTTPTALRDAVRRELHRAETRYRTGVAGVEYLPEDTQFPVLLAATLYAEHHRIIRRADFDVLGADTSLSTARKLAVVARTYWHWRRVRDPVATFERASAVPDRSTAGRGGEDRTPVANVD
jgi:phytoene synthase